MRALHSSFCAKIYFAAASLSTAWIRLSSELRWRAPLRAKLNNPLNFLLAKIRLEDDIRPSRLRRNEFFMHGLDCGSELFPHRDLGPSALHNIARKPPLQAQRVRALDKNSQIEAAPHRGASQKPQSIDNQAFRGRQEFCLSAAGMGCKIVARRGKRAGNKGCRQLP